MRALTLQQPMGWAIVNPHQKAKRIENRPKDLPKQMKDVETVVAVHAGKKWRDDYANMIAEILGIKEIPCYDEPGIIGLMRLSGRVYTHSDPPIVGATFTRATGMRIPTADPWWAGNYGYEIKSAIMFPQQEDGRPAIPCKGMLGFWTVPKELEAQIVEQPGFAAFVPECRWP